MAYKTFSINNAGTLGINSDVAPWDLPPEAITDGKNFRIVAGKFQSVGSYENWSQAHYSSSSWFHICSVGATTPAVGTIYCEPNIKKLYWHKTSGNFGDQSAVLEKIKIGDKLILSLGTYVVTSVTDDTTWMTFGIDIDPIVVAQNEFPVIPNRSLSFGHVRPVSVSSGNYWLVCGKNSVYSFDGGTDPATAWEDVSSGAYAGIGITGEFNWTSCMLGSIPVLNNESHYPEYWSPQNPAQNLQPLDFSAGVDWQTAGKSCKAIRSHRNFLFAIGLTESGVELPSSYRWSHPADNNGLPFTWDETDQSAIASIEQIGGDSGDLLDGLTLRDSFILYSQRSVNALELSSDEFVFNRREMSSTIGLLNRSSIVEIKGNHYFIGDGDIYINNGNTIDSLLHNRFRKRFNSRINSAYFNRSYVTKNIALKEIWFCVPEDLSEYPNVAYIYNWQDNSWAIQDLPVNISHCDYGAKSLPAESYSDYDATPEITYESFANVPFGTQNRTPLDGSLIGCNHVESCLKIIDPTITTVTDDVDCYLERLSIPVDGHIGAFTAIRVYPHIVSTTPVEIMIGSQQRAGGSVTWSPMRMFDPSSDRKLDIRVTGILLCWRISSVGTGMFEYSGMDFEFTSSGKR